MNKLMSHGMDRTRADWYPNAGKTWTKEDDQCDKFPRKLPEVEDN